MSVAKKHTHIRTTLNTMYVLQLFVKYSLYINQQHSFIKTRQKIGDMIFFNYRLCNFLNNRTVCIITTVTRVNSW
jgi:hypothetical protein